MPIEKKAPGIIQRARIKKSMETGIKVIDSLVPIGKGQRELILGDRQTGKTSLAIDTIIHQITKFKKAIKQKENIEVVLCVYVAIGQRQSTIARIADLLEKRGCMEYTTIVSATASAPMGLQYIAPYTGVTIGEY
jgi:F-type H+-transporting ATPase subunit alpha